MTAWKFATRALGAFLLATSSAGAAVIDVLDQGNYGEDGYHCTPCTNYFVGEVIGSDSNNGGLERFFVLRGFFVFDLSSFAEPVVSATLLLPNPPNGPSMGFMSPQGMETLTLFSVESDVNSIIGFPGEIEIPVERGLLNFADLGDGTILGSYVATPADGGTTVQITLNGTALAAINAAIQNSQLFAIGAAITTYDANGVGPASQAEGVFGQSGFDRVQIDLAAAGPVPEPSTAWLFLVGAAGLLAVRRRDAKRLVLGA